MEHLKAYFEEVKDIVDKLDLDSVRGVLSELADLKDRQGRLFVLGVGGSAGNASHAVNDFRKLCGIEAYAPTDNVSELTARTNDEGWAFVFRDWLKVSSLNNQDLILIFSVGGGNEEKNVSVNIIEAIKFARERNSLVVGVVGKEDGYTAKNADRVVVIPTVNAGRVTPHSEAFQTVIWHCFVSHPELQIAKTKW